VINFITVACRIYSRLKWYKNYKNRLRLAKVIVKNKISRFLWFTVYTRCTKLEIENSWDGNDREKRCFEAVPKTVSIGAEVTLGGRLFQRRLPATGNARSVYCHAQVMPDLSL